MNSNDVPVCGEDGKLQEIHLPPRLRSTNFDPQTPLIELFEEAMD